MWTRAYKNRLKMMGFTFHFDTPAKAEIMAQPDSEYFFHHVISAGGYLFPFSHACPVVAGDSTGSGVFFVLIGIFAANRTRVTKAPK